MSAAAKWQTIPVFSFTGLDALLLFSSWRAQWDYRAGPEPGSEWKRRVSEGLHMAPGIGARRLS